MKSQENFLDYNCVGLCLEKKSFIVTPHSVLVSRNWFSFVKFEKIRKNSKKIEKIRKNSKNRKNSKILLSHIVEFFRVFEFFRIFSNFFEFSRIFSNLTKLNQFLETRTLCGHQQYQAQ